MQTMRQMERDNQTVLQTRGELSEEESAAYETQRRTFDRVSTGAAQYAGLTDAACVLSCG
jgi:hypothetical protein